MQHTWRSLRDSGGMARGIDAFARRFDAMNFDIRVIDKRMKHADGVGAAAHTGHHQIRQLAFLRQHLRPRLVADHQLEVPHHSRIGMRASRRTDDVERVFDIGDPVAQRLVHRVFQRARTGGDRPYRCTQQIHPKDIGALPFGIDLAHIDHARKAEAGGHGRRRHAVRARAGLGNDAGLAHAPRQQDLAQAIVDLVCAGVIEVFALEIDFGAAEMLGQARREIERALAAGVMGEKPVQFLLERWILFRCLIGFLKLQQQRHQGLGDKAPAIGAKMSGGIGTGTQGVGQCVHARTVCFAAATKSAIRVGLLTPGALSTPDDTSTIFAPLTAMARAIFSGVRPPAKNQGRAKVRPFNICQSKAAPWPPGRAASVAGTASNRIISRHIVIGRDLGQVARFRDRAAP